MEGLYLDGNRCFSEGIVQVKGCFLLFDIIVSQLQQSIFFMVFANVDIGITSLIPAEFDPQITLSVSIFLSPDGQYRSHQAGCGISDITGGSIYVRRVVTVIWNDLIIIRLFRLCCYINVGASDVLCCCGLGEIFGPLGGVQGHNRTESSIPALGTIYLITVIKRGAAPDNTDSTTPVGSCLK